MARSLDQLPPELLMMILDEFDPPEVFTVIRVNRRFFNLGIRSLWEKQSGDYLAKVPKGRRRLYIPLIQHLKLSGSPKDLYEEFKDSEFPNVKDLSVVLRNDQASIADCRYLTHFMNPGLQCLRLHGAIAADLLHDVPTRCPRLETVSLRSSGPSITPTDFLVFLRGLPYLKDVTIHETDGHTMLDSKVIEFLATSQTLEGLSLNRITRKLLRNALSVKKRFPEVKRLDIKIGRHTVATLAKVFRHVGTLHLTLQRTRGENATEVRIRHLSKLTHLRHLDISVGGDMSFVPEDIVSLRSLKHLRRLSLSGIRDPKVPAGNFGDGDLHRLVSGLPKLDTLYLHLFPCKVTAASFATLAKCCPKLNYCALDGMFNMRDLRDHEAPLFPELRLLRFGYFMDPDITGNRDLLESRAHEHFQLLKKHFPEVFIFTWHHLNSPEEVEFTRRVMRLLRPVGPGHDS